MTTSKRLAACEAEIKALQARVNTLQQMIDNRDAFNNSLAFNVNRLLHEMSRLRERDDNEATSNK
jgi:peptidoglycan hydrolase CwlO-like protein